MAFTTASTWSGCPFTTKLLLPRTGTTRTLENWPCTAEAVSYGSAYDNGTTHKTCCWGALVLPDQDDSARIPPLPSVPY